MEPEDVLIRDAMWGDGSLLPSFGDTFLSKLDLPTVEYWSEPEMADLQTLEPYSYADSEESQSQVVPESDIPDDLWLTFSLTPSSPATTLFDPPVDHQTDAETGGLGFAESNAQVDSPGSKSVGSKRKRSTGNSTTPAQPSKRVSLGRKSKASSPVLECDLDKLSDKPFKCPRDDCDKTFKTKDDLTRHSRIHNPKMKKQCPKCGKELSARQNLTRHMETVHQMDRDGQKLTDEHLSLLGKCDLSGCNYKNSREDKVKNHMKSKHPGVSLINCNRTYWINNPRPCRFICFTPEKLEEHILARHSDKSEASEE